MPKVLRIINRFNLGGPTYNASYLSRYLPEPYETLLIGGVKQEEEGSSEFIAESLGIKPLVVDEMQRNPDIKSDRKAYKRIKKIIKEYQPDIVHTHASKAGALGRLAAHKCGVPVIVHTFHGHVFENYFGKAKTTFYKRVERFLAKKSSAIVAISDKQKDDLTQRFRIVSPKKVHVIPLGFDLDRFQVDRQRKREDFRKKYNLQDDEIAIGIVGRLTAIKNHRMFIEVFAKVREKSTKKIRAFIIGDGEEKEATVQYAADAGLSITFDEAVNADIKFTSWIKNIDWANAGLDIIALTSLNEGTPVSLIEAQASQKPIVTTRVGGVENTVLENETAFLSPSEDVAAMTKHLLNLVENEQLRENMGEAGWEFVKERFHYNRLINDMKDLYDHLLQENIKK